MLRLTPNWLRAPVHHDVLHDELHDKLHDGPDGWKHERHGAGYYQVESL